MNNLFSALRLYNEVQYSVVSRGVSPLCEICKDHPNMAVVITLREAHKLQQFITLICPIEGSMACLQGHTKSPKPQV